MRNKYLSVDQHSNKKSFPEPQMRLASLICVSTALSQTPPYDVCTSRPPVATVLCLCRSFHRYSLRLSQRDSQAELARIQSKAAYNITTSTYASAKLVVVFRVNVRCNYGWARSDPVTWQVCSNAPVSLYCWRKFHEMKISASWSVSCVCLSIFYSCPTQLIFQQQSSPNFTTH